MGQLQKIHHSYHQCPKGKQRDRSTERGLEEIMANLKRKEILTHAPTGMNHEDIILSETGQSQKDKYCMIPLI